MSIDHDAIERHDIIDRYVMGKLSADEAEQFEEHYFACPTCFERVEQTELLRQGLRQAAAQEAAVTVQRLGLLAWMAWRGRVAQTALAFLLTGVFVFPFAYYGPKLKQIEKELLRAREPVVNTPILTLSPERGGSTAAPTHRIRLSRRPTWIVVALELAAIDHETYRMSLLDGAGETVWQGAGLRPDPSGALTLTLHSTFLEAGDYSLRVEGMTPGEPVLAGSFVFRALAAE